MRDYAKVSPHFWIGSTGRELRGESLEVRVVAMYLITSPHATMTGLYSLPLPMLAFETGIPFEGASKALRRLCEVGFCSWDDDVLMVWVHEMARHQIGDELKPADKRCAGVRREYETLPETQLLS